MKQVTAQIHDTMCTVYVDDVIVFKDYQGDKIENFIIDMITYYDQMIDSFNFRKMMYAKMQNTIVPFVDVDVEYARSNQFKVSIEFDFTQGEYIFTNEQMERFIEKLMVSTIELDKCITDISSGNFTEDQIKYICEFIGTYQIENFIKDFEFLP
jgi:hypothetical protein